MGFAYADPDVLTDSQRDAVAEHRRTVQEESRKLSLREMREDAQMSQVELAASLKLSVDRVARMETGDIDRVQFATLRRYVEAMGGRLQARVVGETIHVDLN
ncbi:transcriptional regulator [Arthrobacter sp. MYb211]|uniref:helix-turn-helix domain-containing protein n=1 Tax=Micrococcaceae TaxID=1268 RepID=UPI000CFB2E16|nr:MULTISPECIES: helix-turn-helix transcriptional regulator [unclassified Arthrobacter]PRA04134.1 transcriptional regulator [Arthrobacter sp. MYb229]PRA11648.1 transcriptional regulator [Arthrobacter sp. MYb221]PRB51954.1 transcriptional regulator [Arthrobacter sp. MYb216]PRC07849.1 transcriptional regulator [Arthrobacter sp. MYb211]